METIRERVFDIGMDRHDGTTAGEKEKKIDAAIPRETSSEHLMKLGMFFYLYAYPMNAGDNHMDDAFYYASRKCARILAGRRGAREGHYLRMMKSLCGPDAGESLFYTQLIEAQNQSTQ